MSTERTENTEELAGRLAGEASGAADDESSGDSGRGKGGSTGGSSAASLPVVESGKKSKDKAGRKKKIKRHVSTVVVHVFASFNNTIVTITDPKGNTLSWASSGGSNFKGSRKSTPFAGQVVATKALAAAKELHGFTEAKIYVDGPGPGRDAAIRAVRDFAAVLEIHDVTSTPFNGCKAPKERRV
jgi:small subunit ribosomal protein S11